MQLLIKGIVVDQQRVQSHLSKNDKYLRRVMASLVGRNDKAIILSGQHPQFCLAVRSRINNPEIVPAIN